MNFALDKCISSAITNGPRITAPETHNLSKMYQKKVIYKKKIRTITTISLQSDQVFLTSLPLYWSCTLYQRQKKEGGRMLGKNERTRTEDKKFYKFYTVQVKSLIQSELDQP